MAQDTSLLEVLALSDKGLGALHRVSDALGSVDQLVAQMLVLLHRHVVRGSAEVPLLGHWLLLLKRLARGILLHDVYLVHILALFARLHRWTRAAAAANSLNAAHFAGNRRVFGVGAGNHSAR
jgi:hypothetical protein